MRQWHKSDRPDFGRVLLRWRQKDSGRLVGKAFSWLLAAFIMGICISILCAALGLHGAAKPLSRLAFLITLVGGMLNSYFIYAVSGSEYRIYEKAFVAVRPLIGYAPLAEKWGCVDKPLAARFEHLNWEEIKEAHEKDGALLLVLKKNLEEVEVGVAPVTFVSQETAAPLSKKSNGDNLDRETLKLILQKIREIKRVSTLKG